MEEKKSYARLVGYSTRLTLTYVVLIVWLALAIFAILIKADLVALAAYFASGLPVILGYLWSETSRPTVIPDTTTTVTPTNITPTSVKSTDQDYIYSDDDAVKITINKNQLNTLKNTGYINNVNNKYTFKKSSLDQIKSLINYNSNMPNI